jgi:hypothetical protein
MLRRACGKPRSCYAFQHEGFKAVVTRIVQCYLRRNNQPPLFDTCSDVCKAIYQALPSDFKEQYVVYIVRGVWDWRHTYPVFRKAYMQKYPGREPSVVTHDWLAVCDRNAPELTVASLQPRHMFDPTCCQFVDAAWQYGGCVANYSVQRSAELMLRADKVY